MLCYRKNWVLIVIAIYFCMTFSASADHCKIDQVDGNWHIVCDIEIRDLFTEELLQYQYKQQKLDVKEIKDCCYRWLHLWL